MMKTILVATDGSEAASAAERFGIELAAKLDATVSGITVAEERDMRAPNADNLSLPSYPESELAAYYRARAEAVAKRFGNTGQNAGPPAHCETVQGIADEKIVDRAQGADVLVAGRDGKGVASHGALIGSTIHGIVHKINRSTIVVPPGATLSGPIVLGFDGSPGSRIAANLAVQLANGLGEAVHVFVDSKDKGRAVARFEEVRQLVGGLAVPVRETSSTLGRPDVKIVDAAREARAGFIAMGAFGRNRISDYFLGSNAAAVIRTSPVAVLLAR